MLKHFIFGTRMNTVLGTAPFLTVLTVLQIKEGFSKKQSSDSCQQQK
jgi:hypothetical protein